MTKTERDALLEAAPLELELARDGYGDVDAGYGAASESYVQRVWSVVREFVPLSLVAFGGPAAHLGLAHDRFVVVRKWISDERFLELLSIAQATPGPGSTEVVTGIALFRAGPIGAALALFCWILPSFCVLTIAGISAQRYLQDGLPDWMKGIASAAVALVVLASVRLWQKAVGEHRVKAIVATAAACIVVTTQGFSSVLFPLTMLAGGIVVLASHSLGIERIALRPDTTQSEGLSIKRQLGMSPLVGGIILLLWFAVLVWLAIFRPQDAAQHSLLSLFATLYWIGSIIFGGGQVMLPMLLHAFVQLDWVTKEQFLAGFALVQTLPGPLFNISAYLGALLYGPIGAVVAVFGFFTPGISLFVGLLPLWERVRSNAQLQVFIGGVNAAACGFVVASVFLLWEKAVHSNGSAAAAIAAGIAVGVFRLPSPLAIVLGALIGFVLSPGVLNLGQEDFCEP